jgi:hypothetical protein
MEIRDEKGAAHSVPPPLNLRQRSRTATDSGGVPRA